MVGKKKLLLIAGLVWGIAGFNVLRIGIEAYSGYANLLNIVLTLLVYILFQSMVFGRMVKKHTVRITGYLEEKQWFWRFFDKKAFCIMAFMITFGIILRISNICPDRFIAIFYTGLGASLFTAGILFWFNYGRYAASC